jgi:hypothetical protein
MTEAATNFSFPQFASLPPELRLLIWREAMSDDDDPALFPYRSDAWQLYSWLDAVEAELRPELLGQVRVKIPIAYVNHEARETAIAWAPNIGMEVNFHMEKSCYTFLRPFDPALDTIYIPYSLVEDFNRRSWGGFTPVDDVDDVSVVPSELHFAVPEGLFQAESTRLLSETIWCLVSSPLLFVVADPQPEFEDDMSLDMQSRWEIDGANGAMGFILNKRTEKMVVKPGNRLHDKTFQRVYDMIGIVDDAIKGLLDTRVCDFEIRPGHVVRRW